MKCFLLFFLVFSLNARAEMGNIFGIGAYSQGMGSVSLVQGVPSPFQTYAAPAALGFLRNVEVSVGAQYMDSRLRPFGSLVLNSNGTIGEFNSAGVLSGGGQVFAMGLPIGKVRPLTLGAVVYLPFSSLVRVSGAPVNYPFYPLYNDLSRNFFLVIGAGYELFDGLALGINFRSTTQSNAFYSLRSDNTINYSASAVEAKGQSRISASVLFDAERRGGAPFSIGAMYRARAGLQTKLAADVTAFVPIQGELISFPSYSPAEWVLMGAARFNDNWKTSLDVAWVKWSDYVSPYGTGNINSYAVDSVRKEALFRDILVPRIGVEYTHRSSGFFKQSQYRVGYLYHPSPVPDQTGDSNFVDNNRHLFSLGWGLGFSNPWREGDLVELDLFGQYNWLKSRKITKNTTTTVGAPGYTAGGKIWMYGMSATLRF